jgi:histidyl-tRNA synthetase
VRAGIENGLLHNQVQRFWYYGPMFRRERPQKGRYRQFFQIGVEAFGMPGPDIDVELLFICNRLWKALGIQNEITMQINSLGSNEARGAYREALVQYLEKKRSLLDDDSLRRLDRNPLRVLDSKNPAMESVIAEAPSLIDFLDEASREHFESLKTMLDQENIPYQVNPRLVRGLDYYNATVFEWLADKLGAQSAICAGGRFDGLVHDLGGKPTPAIGFALGLERLIALLVELKLTGSDASPHIYVCMLGEAAEYQGRRMSELLRDQGLRVECHCGAGSLKSQLKRADKSGARLALIIGDAESSTRTVKIKNMRTGQEQHHVAQTDVWEHARACLT